jgi:agmatine deiminase
MTDFHSSAPADTPAGLGFRLPAEWEPHAATWIGWPANATDWPGKFVPIRWVYAEIVRKLCAGERVRILVNGDRETREAAGVLARSGVDLARVDLLAIPTNRGWTRDSGPAFVKSSRTGERAVVDFRFNAWAKYPDWQLDDAMPAAAAERFGLRVFRTGAAGREVVLEGGSIDINGRGTLVTTEECLLDEAVQTRNPGFGKAEYEAVFRDCLGAGKVIWLGQGIAGDDTHGHVDDLCRFVGPRTLVLCREQDPKDANYRPLEENRERLEDARLEDGSRPEVVALPMPAPLFFDSVRLPASYANFYIGNAAVLVPTFNDPNDRVALGILAELITDRPVIGIHAVDLVWGLGTLHCLTHEEPGEEPGSGPAG